MPKEEASVSRSPAAPDAATRAVPPSPLGSKPANENTARTASPSLSVAVGKGDPIEQDCSPRVSIFFEQNATRQRLKLEAFEEITMENRRR
eukprot:CAMPEP_0206617744 /NCGR_PEP_ID=MMETSP0325_2-20121206/59806_1 /ASSEMBLY_ACC=CAM_ASM_000347 /TAXON_ID=2866 /ORGANISM="Crypthecodinium cohnii, Strain Seligo" /LENGTH=90 /DNA_ID=CAMNT_0054139763 /DNA_START=14 /DNA_END=283 /DNA_ORIENTATION=-